jgi:hypothetical protein
MNVLENVTKWGLNASPFTIAKTYLDLNWSNIKFFFEVSKAAKQGRMLVFFVDGLARSARLLKKAVGEQASAEFRLPAYPLRPDDKSGSVLVSKGELAYVEKYFNTAAMIANDAAGVRAEVSKAIKDWGDVVSKAEKIKDWTRKAAWEAVTLLDDRFQFEAGGFRAYLVDLRDTAQLQRLRERMEHSKNGVSSSFEEEK